MYLKRQADQWAEVGGHRIRYWKKGNSSPTILLIHGMGCSCLEWSENIDALANHATVVAVDMLGFGKSDKPDGYDYSPVHQAVTLIKLLEHLQVEEVHLVGNSLGGRVAIEMASILGDKAKSLTLAASAGGATDAPHAMRLQTLPIVGKWLTKPDRIKHQVGWSSVFVNKSRLSQERIDEKFQDSLLPGAQASALSTVRSMIDLRGFKRQDIEQLHEKIKALNTRVMIIWGDSDPLLPVHHAAKFQSLLKNAVVHIFKQCGHAPQIEQADKFNQLLAQFIR
jgi:4,5:9,10-diseco-3-hydroxy-5,9,17-trioxoandrosta-1(10),2-diene-4-oate hydrolase